MSTGSSNTLVTVLSCSATQCITVRPPATLYYTLSSYARTQQHTFKASLARMVDTQVGPTPAQTANTFQTAENNDLLISILAALLAEGDHSEHAVQECQS